MGSKIGHNKGPLIEDDTQATKMLAKVAEWSATKIKLAKLKIEESTMRSKLFAFYFPLAKEGKTVEQMPEDWYLEGTQKMNRKIDEAALKAVMEQLPEGSEDRLIKWKPELKLREYNKLHKKQQAIMDEAIIMTKATGSMKLCPPKKKKE